MGAGTGTAGLGDILTAIKNLVTGVTGLGQTYLQVNGKGTAQALTGTQLVSSSAGRLVSVSVTTAGTTVGYAYDSNSTGTLTRPIFPIDNLLGLQPANLPVSYGIVVVLGSGMVATVNYS